MALVSYALAKQHLRLTDDNSQADVTLKADVASAIVLAYIGRSAADSPVWDDSIDPADDADFAIVQAAVLKVLANLWRWRGDDQPPEDSPLTADVRGMLKLVADHVLS